MANDRVFLVCRHCKEGVYLAKWMCQGWYRKDGEGDGGDMVGSTFLAFMDDHQWCGLSGGDRGSAHVEMVHEDPVDLEGVTLEVPGCVTRKDGK